MGVNHKLETLQTEQVVGAGVIDGNSSNKVERNPSLKNKAREDFIEGC